MRLSYATIIVCETFTVFSSAVSKKHSRGVLGKQEDSAGS